MKYFSAMTLSDFLRLNWQDLDPNLVSILEKYDAILIETKQQYIDLLEYESTWEEKYRELLYRAEEFSRKVEYNIDKYTHMGCSSSELVTNLRLAVEKTDFDVCI